MDVSYKTHAPVGLSENRVPKSTELYYFSNIAIRGSKCPTAPNCRTPSGPTQRVRRAPPDGPDGPDGPNPAEEFQTCVQI